jgi:hypothetical protein
VKGKNTCSDLSEYSKLLLKMILKELCMRFYTGFIFNGLGDERQAFVNTVMNFNVVYFLTS